MHRIVAIVAFVLLIAAGSFARTEETVPDLLKKAEAARVEDRPGLYLHAAELRLRAADKLYTSGKADEGRAAVSDVVEYSQKAVDAATKTGKKLKNSEITIR